MQLSQPNEILAKFVDRNHYVCIWRVVSVKMDFNSKKYSKTLTHTPTKKSLKFYFCNTLVLSHNLIRKKHQADWIILPAEKMGGKDISSA